VGTTKKNAFLETTATTISNPAYHSSGIADFAAKYSHNTSNASFY
jgi:hypothetical protein